jgi:GTP cyclohydrolase I
LSYDKTKTDPVLGREIREYLISQKVETPIISGKVDASNNEKIAVIEQHFTGIYDVLGMDLANDSLSETPSRIAKMFVLESFYGLKEENFPKCTTVANEMEYDELVVEKHVKVVSQCEHHNQTFNGTATVGYIPKNRVLGLSKIPRIVEYFCRRPQIQERLTAQIYHALCYVLDTDAVAVIIEAKHMCVCARGVEDVNPTTTTSKLGPPFKNSDALRAEFLSIASRPSTI